MVAAATSSLEGNSWHGSVAVLDVSGGGGLVGEAFVASGVTTVAWLDGGAASWLAAACDDGDVLLLRAPEEGGGGQPAAFTRGASLGYHHDSVSSLSASASGSALVSGSWDGT